MLKKADMNARDWQTLTDRATWLLRNPDQASPRENLQGMALQLRLWRYPIGGRRVSWSIFLPIRDYRGRMAIVREVSWDPCRERKRSRTVDRDIRIRDAEIKESILAPFLNTAGEFHPGVIGTVAASATHTNVAGIEGSRGLSHVRLEWSGRGPRGYAATIAWFKQFRQLLAGTFRKSGRG